MNRTLRKLIFKFSNWLIIALVISSCGNNGSTPTQGKQKIYIDESYSQLFAAEVEAFEGFYKESDIDDRYKPEGDMVNDFMNDSCRIIILSRDLNQKEKDYFKSKNSFPTSTKIAVDALAFITNKENPVSDLLYSELENIFTGKISSWKFLDSSIKEKSSQDTGITIVFDNEKSCNVRMLKDKLLNGNDFPKNCFAVKSNPEVVDYVSKNKGALGIIGVNWISDADDTLTRSFLSKVNVLGVASKEDDGTFFQPYQAHVYTGEYPFCRNVFIINREGRTGLGTGFAAFVAGEKGQLIILKAGMVPATQPVRMVHINNN
ncbi:MAG: substrate-binding domain-containing protein [Bacteroidetes bacterium]|nr:substrate-binding domain-containing protein [Bacteroidota bacterium]